MIRLGFSIAWPFAYKDRSRHFLLYDKRIASHKSFELQISQFGCDKIVEVDLDLNWHGRDHAGPRIEISVFGFFFCAKIYDNRHWNYDEHRWENYDDY